MIGFVVGAHGQNQNVKPESKEEAAAGFAGRSKPLFKSRRNVFAQMIIFILAQL